MWAVVQYILGGISISQNPPASQIKTMNQTTTAHAQQHQDQQFYMGQLETLLIRVIYIASAISLRVHSMQYAI